MLIKLCAKVDIMIYLYLTKFKNKNTETTKLES